MNNNGGSNRIPFISRTQLILSVAICPAFIVIFALLSLNTNISEPVLAVILSFLYLLTVAIVSQYFKKKIDAVPSPELYELLEEKSSLVLRNSKTPMLLLDSYGTILWLNESMHDICVDKENYIGQNISSVIKAPINKDTFHGKPIEVFGRIYEIEGFTISESGNGLYLVSLNDVTDFKDVEKRYADERIAVAYVSIDNVEDIVQYVHEKFKDAVSEVDDKIKSFARSLNGIIKSYDNDKYIIIFESAMLDECIKNRFSILDEIRDSRVGDGVSITASIGVSRIKGSLADRERAAREALDLAFQRGGDQAVYKSDSGIEYYGGITKSVFKRSSVQSRTFANQLSATMVKADNVIIMGHRYGDFDSFGASVGIARLAMRVGVKVNIAVDMRDGNLLPCVEMLEQLPIHAQTFVDSAEAFDLVGPDTLVVLVDHNTVIRSQFTDIAKRVNKLVIIDHHRKNEVMPANLIYSYVEPSASSTCELVAEMLEVSLASNNLLKQEADILLAGILLDTKQFTRNTGTRTFGAAQYLRGCGANPSDVYDMFKTSPQDLAKESRFHTNIIIYNTDIAISSCEGDTDESYRIIASKAADKMLTLKGVEASFTIVRIGEEIHISGRSNGKINVQLILERIGGGGHFDIAGAQIKSETVTNVLEALKNSIDDYIMTVNSKTND